MRQNITLTRLHGLYTTAQTPQSRRLPTLVETQTADIHTSSTKCFKKNNIEFDIRHKNDLIICNHV